jgi:hypothetical protein
VLIANPVVPEVEMLPGNSLIPLGGLITLFITVVLLATVTASASRAFARIAAVAAQIVGVVVNLSHLILAMLSGMIGFMHLTDTDAEFNNRLALVGFSCAGIAMVNCLALVGSRRAFFRVLLPMAAVGNCVTVTLAVLAFVRPTIDVIGGVSWSATFFGVTFISVNAIAIRAAYYARGVAGRA